MIEGQVVPRIDELFSWAPEGSSGRFPELFQSAAKKGARPNDSRLPASPSLGAGPPPWRAGQDRLESFQKSLNFEFGRLLASASMPRLQPDFGARDRLKNRCSRTAARGRNVLPFANHG